MYESNTSAASRVPRHTRLSSYQYTSHRKTNLSERKGMSSCPVQAISPSTSEGLCLTNWLPGFVRFSLPSLGGVLPMELFSYRWAAFCSGERRLCRRRRFHETRLHRNSPEVCQSNGAPH